MDAHITHAHPIQRQSLGAWRIYLDAIAVAQLGWYLAWMALLFGEEKERGQ